MNLKWIMAIVIIFGLLTTCYMLQMSTVLKTLLILMSVLLIGIVLMQAGRGGGLAAIGGLGDQAAFGTKSSTILSKLTYLVGASFIFTTILLTKLTLSSIHGTGTLGKESFKAFQETTHTHEEAVHEHEPAQGLKGFVTDEESVTMKEVDVTTEKQEDKESESKSTIEEKTNNKQD